MNFLDFFAGIGGFRTGLERVGGICKGFAEIDKYARQSYKAMHDTEGELEWHDITAVTDDDFRRLRGTIDLIAGGFPCQAFSVAGKRMGFNESRGTLFFHIARAAKEIKPRYLLLENVKGLVSHDQGRTLTVILNTLQELGYGHIEWGIFNSKFWGVPQNRERIFIVAELTDEPQRPYLLDLLKDQEGNGVQTRLCDILETNVDEKYYLSDEKTKALIEKLDDRVLVKEATTKGYAEAYPGDAVNLTQPNSKTRRGRVGREMANTLLTGLEQAVIVPNRNFVGIGHHPFSKKQEFSGFHDDVSPCLIATDYKAPKCILEKVPQIEIAGCINPNGFRQTNEVLSVDGLSACLRTFQGGGLQPKIAEPGEGRRYRIRKLTPLECWRLQGFSDEQHQAAVDDGLSDSQRYKQAGNSVTVNVIEAIATELRKRM